MWTKAGIKHGKQTWSKQKKTKKEPCPKRILLKQVHFHVLGKVPLRQMIANTSSLRFLLRLAITAYIKLGVQKAMESAKHSKNRDKYTIAHIEKIDLKKQRQNFRVRQLENEDSWTLGNKERR